MPDNFFEAVHNASAHSNLTYTTGRELTNRRRRLNSQFCRSSFSDLENGFVLMGNKKIAEETAYSSWFWNEPSFESDTFFIVHNSPNDGLLWADEICFEIIYSVNPIGFNTDRQRELRPHGSSGIVCDNCYAHAGAHALAGLRCLKVIRSILCLCECRCENYNWLLTAFVVQERMPSNHFNIFFRDPTLFVTSKYQLGAHLDTI